MAVTIQQVRQALELADFDVIAAQGKMAPVTRPTARPPEMPGRPRLGAVLALLFCRRHELHVLLTKRHDDLPSHPGQISFPGGRNEAPESLLATALRETEEEVGIAAPDVEILGALAPIYVPPSDYEVHPFVAWFSSGESPIFRAAPQEVDRILEAPLATFLDSASRVEEPWDIRGQQVLVPYFVVGEYKVWGATAVMLSELVERLRVVLQ